MRRVDWSVLRCAIYFAILDDELLNTSGRVKYEYNEKMQKNLEHRLNYFKNRE